MDEAVGDLRFAPGGRFGHFAFSVRAGRSDVERALRAGSVFPICMAPPAVWN